jgi:hypothetical protein
MRLRFRLDFDGNITETCGRDFLDINIFCEITVEI